MKNSASILHPVILSILSSFFSLCTSVSLWLLNRRSSALSQYGADPHSENADDLAEHNLRSPRISRKWSDGDSRCKDTTKPDIKRTKDTTKPDIKRTPVTFFKTLVTPEVRDDWPKFKCVDRRTGRRSGVTVTSRRTVWARRSARWRSRPGSVRRRGRRSWPPPSPSRTAAP